MLKVLTISLTLLTVSSAFAQPMTATRGGFTDTGYAVQEEIRDGGFTSHGATIKEPKPSDKPMPAVNDKPIFVKEPKPLDKPMPAVNDKPIFVEKSGSDPLPTKPNLVQCSYDGDGKSVWCDGKQYVRKKNGKSKLELGQYDGDREVTKSHEDSESKKRKFKLNKSSAQ